MQVRALDWTLEILPAASSKGVGVSALLRARSDAALDTLCVLLERVAPLMDTPLHPCRPRQAAVVGSNGD